MTGRDAIKTALKSAQHLLNWYVSDLSDADLLVRPVSGANHIAWQLGHLVSAEGYLLGGQLPGALTVNAWNQGELYAFHTGICNVALGDGSVRSLRSNISFSVMLRLAARADGYPVSPDE